MTIQNIIKKYQEKIAQKDKAIETTTQMIQEAKGSNTPHDIEDLIGEKINAEAEKQVYLEVIKDLKKNVYESTEKMNNYLKGITLLK